MVLHSTLHTPDRRRAVDQSDCEVSAGKKACIKTYLVAILDL